MITVLFALIFSILAFMAQDHFAYRLLGDHDRRVRNYFVWTTLLIYFGITVIV